MFDIAIVVLIFSSFLVIYRAIIGHDIFTRVLAVNFLGTKAVLILALIGFAYGRPHFLDIALLYALINFVATIAFLKYKLSGRLG